MELLVIDGLLTVAQEPRAPGGTAWTQAALLASSLAEADGSPLWQTLARTLETAGWQVESSQRDMLPLSALARTLRSDPPLARLLDRRGGMALTGAATALLDIWWQHNAVAAGNGERIALLATLGTNARREPLARLYALTLPAPCWRWLLPGDGVQVQLSQLTLRLDAQRYASLAATLENRARGLGHRVRSMRVEPATPSHGS